MYLSKNIKTILSFVPIIGIPFGIINIINSEDPKWNYGIYYFITMVIQGMSLMALFDTLYK